MSRKTEPVAGTAGVPALPLPRATVEHGPKESIYYLDGVKVRKSPRRDYAGAILRRETRGGVDGPWKVIGFRKTFLAAFNEAHSSGVGFAERLAPKVFAGQIETTGKGDARPRRFTDVRTHADRLAAPMSWRKPARVFVNSMSDLFHESVPFEFVDDVFATMAAAPRHTFQILTKRPTRMREYLSSAGTWIRVNAKLWRRCKPVIPGGSPLILPNVWLGVSVESQDAAWRIEQLLAIPAAVRFVSCEPLLERVDLRPWFHDPTCEAPSGGVCSCVEPRGVSLDWVIAGGESGPAARPCDVEWIRSLVEQCREAEKPVFVKQLGRRPVVQERSDRRLPTRLERAEFAAGGGWPLPLRDSKGGNPDEWPADLRVREFPTVPT